MESYNIIVLIYIQKKYRICLCIIRRFLYITSFPYLRFIFAITFYIILFESTNCYIFSYLIIAITIISILTIFTSCNNNVYHRIKLY